MKIGEACPPIGFGEMEFWMQLLSAFGRGAISGTQARDRGAATPPQHYGFDSNLTQALYWFGFEIGNVIVFGKRASG